MSVYFVRRMVQMLGDERLLHSDTVISEYYFLRDLTGPKEVVFVVLCVCVARVTEQSERLGKKRDRVTS